MQLQKTMSSTIKMNENNPRYSLPSLPSPAQTPSLLMNKREQRRQSFYPGTNKSVKRLPSFESEQTNASKSRNKGTSAHRLSHLAGNQQYETTLQLTMMRNEIKQLTERLILSEQKVQKWKKEFKDLQNKFMRVEIENIHVKQDLQDTRRMLEESEHIRSRWFVKQPQEETMASSNSLPKKLSQHHR